MANILRGPLSIPRIVAASRTVAVQAQAWVTENLFGLQNIQHGPPPGVRSTPNVLPPLPVRKVLPQQAQAWVTENLFGVQKIVHGPPAGIRATSHIFAPMPKRAAFAQAVFATNLLLTTLAGTSVTVTPATASLTTTAYAPTVSASNVKPFAQTDWQNPVLSKRRSIQYEQRDTSRFYSAVSVVPSTASLTLTGYAPSVTVSGGAVPFTVTDWPNPLTRIRQVVPQSHRYAGAPVYNTVVTPSTASLTLTGHAPTVTASGGASSVPFTQTDWPNPRINPRYKQQPAGGRALGEEPFPFTQTEWPNPILKILARPAWTNGLAPALVGAPISVTPGTASLTITGYAPTVTASNVQPFAQTNWTNPALPKRRAQSHDQRDTGWFYGAVNVTPGTAALILTTYAPEISVSGEGSPYRPLWRPRRR